MGDPVGHVSIVFVPRDSQQTSLRGARRGLQGTGVLQGPWDLVGASLLTDLTFRPGNEDLIHRRYNRTERSLLMDSVEGTGLNVKGF